MLGLAREPAIVKTLQCLFPSVKRVNGGIINHRRACAGGLR